MTVSELHARVKKCGLTLHKFCLDYGIGLGSMHRLAQGIKPMTWSEVEKRLKMLEKGEDLHKPCKIV